MQYHLQSPITNLALFVIGSIIWLFAPASAVAQPEAPVSLADYVFGQKLRFQLTADLPDDIRSVQLIFRSPQLATEYVADVDFTHTATGETAVTHVVNLSQIALPPFATITYFWVLSTDEGQEIRIPPQTFVYRDDRFTWQEQSQDNITVYWTGEDAGLGEVAHEIVVASLPQLLAVAPIPEAVTIAVYPSSADLRTAIRLSGNEWAGPHLNSALGVVFVTAVNARTAANDLGQRLPHELAHFFIFAASDDDLPFWLNEGIATLVEQNPDPNYEAALATAVADDSTIPFHALCVNSLADVDVDMALAYGQSASMVEYIQTTNGDQVIRDLLSAFADGDNCDTAVSTHLSLSLSELETAWLRSRQQQPLWLQVVQDNATWLLLVAGSFALMGLLIWRR